MADDIADHIEQERRVLLLLARNQSERQHIVAAGRHLEQLGALLRSRAAGTTPAPAAPLRLKTA